MTRFMTRKRSFRMTAAMAIILATISACTDPDEGTGSQQVPRHEPVRG